MAKPDPALLDPARYPFNCMIEPRFGDLDVNLHINNVALIGILEDARVRFHRASGYHAAATTMTSMVASFSAEYLGQSYYPDPLQIYVAAARVGRTSYIIDQLVMQRGKVSVFAESVMVCVGDGGAMEVPQAFRESIAPWMLRA